METSSFLQLALALAVIIAAAKSAGALSVRLGQPAVLGELLAGVLVGPSLIDVLHWPVLNSELLTEEIHALAQVGVLLVMFMAGLDLHLGELAVASRVAGLAGTLGVLVPMGIGIASGLLFGMDMPAAVFLGLTVSATSVSISAQVLMELKALRTRLGTSLLGAAVLDDILVILALSVYTALSTSREGAGWAGVLIVLVRIVLFLAISSLLGWWLLPRLVKRVHLQPVSQGLTAFVFVTVLAYGWLAEAAGGMSALAGAFLAGVWIGRTPLKERIGSGIGVVTYGIFAPIFFMNIGLSADMHKLDGASLLLFGALAVAAIFGKVIGAGAAGVLGGLPPRQALELGVGMMAHGEVDLIVVSIGVAQGYIPQAVFPAVVGIVVLSTLLTPPILRAILRGAPEGATT